MPPSHKDVRRFLDAWMQMRQIVQAANFNQFQRAGLSATQFMTLNVLPAAGDGMTLTELARRLNLSPATLTKTVESLEARALVRRERAAYDARRLSITVTAEGAALQNAAAGEFHAYMGGLFAGMSASDRAGLLAGLEAIVRLGTAGATRRGAADVVVRGKRSSR